MFCAKHKHSYSEDSYCFYCVRDEYMSDRSIEKKAPGVYSRLEEMMAEGSPVLNYSLHGLRPSDPSTPSGLDLEVPSPPTDHDK